MTLTHTTHRHGRRAFVRHYLEMLVAMAAGMMLGPLLRSAAGLEPSAGAGTGAVLMAVDMSVAMVVWMRIRGHGWPATLEMAGVMVAPVAVLAPLHWLGLFGADALLLAEHVVMLPLMWLAMLRRPAEYGRWTR
ncbi:hypothetical protein [Jiangella alkaliphila]|uniref:Flagellar biosynthetic protein FliP n=1 Tax=Jiangella alkaliphila TaxID=419479 RepID=A0A1H2L285_9ACTN|nr:hypothetical protein [Jiangella alkaliphila]SDU74656.1 flagellar biosynthetic protein FliP [Jiangella alkaliphila]